MEYLISNAKINKVKVSRADYEKKQKKYLNLIKEKNRQI